MNARSLRRRLFAGLAVIAPVSITVYVLRWIFNWLDGLLGKFIYPHLPDLPFQVRGLGLLVLLLILLMIGWAAEWAVGRRIVNAWHTTLERFPLTRRLYTASHRIVRTIFGEEQRFFREVVIVEYPAPGRWSLGFVTSSGPTAMQPHIDDAVTVFIPTTPNPTTGFLIIVPRSTVRPVDFTIEEAFTFILSAGGVQPDGPIPATAMPESTDAGTGTPVTLSTAERATVGARGEGAAD
jgi:uncharacterized membrane protein